MPAFGYTNQTTEEVEETENQVTPEIQELEDRAHAHKVLISSDAMQHFLAACHQVVDRIAFLDKVVAEAKVSYPMEDGWVVLNQARMHELCEKRGATTPLASGVEVADDKKAAIAADTEATLAPVTNSLAEAIIDGNVMTAYKLIDGRPMIALAGASADFDSLYRYQNGESVVLSEILKECAETIPQEKVQTAIGALTQTVDGTYPSEEAAVKVAIMKAIKALA